MLGLCPGCGPTLPPTQAPAQPNPVFEPFREALQAYVDRSQPFRKEAAQAQQDAGRGGTAPSATSLRRRQNVLAEALQTRLRPDARPGELFTPDTAAAITSILAQAFRSDRRALILDELAEQHEGQETAAVSAPAINSQLKAPRVPPRLAEILPPLPKQLEYDFAGRTLILRDVDADVVVDYLPDALPAWAPATLEPRQPAAARPGTVAPLPLPEIRGSTVFAVMGDSGSGDVAQRQIAQAMLTYFETARRFGFVLMLGDNLYHDDYQDEFLIPYKPLLDRGVKFYATLGNHDRDLQQHFKPFNMGDRDRYSFDQGNIRFVTLNSNHPGDAAQLKFLDDAFAGAGDRWRIVFFHHPLYSSGTHAAESREVIRPAFEDALVRNRVNVAFAGHEHAYERIRPQRGIHHFVSGGGGRYLYKLTLSDFDEVGISEHHFMVVQVSGDTLLFEAIAHGQNVLDCGVVYRTPDAAAKPDPKTARWLADCETAKPHAVTTRPD